MSRRPALCVLLVLLAGCGTGPPASDTTPVTPAAVPDDDPDNPAAGVVAGRAVDAEQFVAGQRERVGDRSLTVSQRTTVRAPNGSIRSRLSLTYTLGPGNRSTTVAREGMGTAPLYEAYHDGSTRFSRGVTPNGGVTYGRAVRAPLEPFEIPPTTFLGALLDGTTVVRVTEGSPTVVTLNRTDVQFGREWERFSLTLREGRLVGATAVYTRPTGRRDEGGPRDRYTVEWAFTGLGETAVTEPAWLDEARAATTVE